MARSFLARGVAAACLLGSLACNSKGGDSPDASAAFDAGFPDVAFSEGGEDASAPDASATDTGAPRDAGQDAVVVDAGPPVWHAGPTLPVARIHSIAAAPGNGYLYVAGGYVDASVCNSGTVDNRVFYAKQAADGSLGAWSEAPVAPAGSGRSIPGHAEANGFLYVAGGAIGGPVWDGSVWFARPDATGSIPTWTKATNAAPTWIGSAPVMAVTGNTLLVGAGFNAFASPQVSSHLFLATLDPSTGQPGAFTQLADLPEAPSQGQLVVSEAGFAYFAQGTNADLYVASLATLTASADAGVADAGAIWALSKTPLPFSAPPILNLLVDGTRLVASAGSSPDLYVSDLQADGSLGAWTKYPPAPANVSAGNQGIITGGFYYALGFNDCNATMAEAQATTYVKAP